MKKLIITIAAVLTLVASTLPALLARANDAGPLDSVAISPASALVAVNSTQQFTAVSKDAANQTVGNVSNVTYNWSVVAGGGTINATGLFTAGNTSGTFNGTVQVTAVQGNITRTANATVIVDVPGQLVSLAVSPAAVTLPVNGTRQFAAVAKDAFNQTATGVNLTWSVVAGGGTINSTSGLFTAGNATGTFNGTVQVSAVQDNITKTATATVTVGIHGTLDHFVISPANATVAVNGTRQFTAIAKDIFNNNVSNVTYNWSVVAGGGTINATSGLFAAGNTTGTFNGTVQVTAVQGDITRTANATVTVTIKSGEKPCTPPGWEKGKKKGWDDDDNPPGWEHGKKKGWDDDHTPKGLAKDNDKDEDEDDDQGEHEAKQANHGRPCPCTDKGKDTGNADRGNAGNTTAAGNADNHGKKGQD